MTNLLTVRVTIERFEAPEEVWAAIGDEIYAAAIRAAELRTLIGADAEVELIEGSFKAKATLIGAMATAYSAIADYKGFKESISEMAKDGREIATMIRDEIPKIVSHKRDIARQDVKNRTIIVTAEELSKLIKRLERLKEKSQTMNEAEISAELARIGRGFRFLRKQLDGKDLEAVEQLLSQGDLPVPRRPLGPLFGGEPRAIIRPDSYEEIRLRIEQGSFEEPKYYSAQPSGATSSGPKRRRRRMYFKRGPVHGAVDMRRPY